MNSEAIFNAAHSTAIKLFESGAFITPADTVCSIESGSGRIYTGISRADMNALIHAEVDAVRNMQAAGENVIKALLLISTQNRTPMLPCNNCLGYILSLAPENANCVILMQDRLIGINEVGMFAAPMGAGPENPNFSVPTHTQFPQYTAHAAAAPKKPAAAADAEKNDSPLELVHSVSIEEIQEVSATVEANNVGSNGNILKGRVKDLLKAADDDTDEFLDSLPSPKKRFGFFRK
jgi:hypothetical protein